MNAKHRERKQLQRRAHARREDNRRPSGSEPLDAIRDRARDERRKARREAA